MEASLDVLLAKVRVIAETPRLDLLKQIVDLIYAQIETEYDDEPLSDEDLDAIRRGQEDYAQGRFITLDEYERKRGL